MLTCLCDDTPEFYYDDPKDFTVLDAERYKCDSCTKVIRKGNTCLTFTCWSVAEDEWEDDEQITPRTVCEKCGEIYFNLSALGYCMVLGENWKDTLKEYWDITNFNPEDYK